MSYYLLRTRDLHYVTCITKCYINIERKYKNTVRIQILKLQNVLLIFLLRSQNRTVVKIKHHCTRTCIQVTI